MEQLSFLPPETKPQTEFELDNGLSVKILDSGRRAILYRGDIQIRDVNLTDKVAYRIFLVEAIESGATRIRLAKAFNVSRQTLHNYQECRKHFGLEGLVHNYGSRKTSRKTARSKHAEKLPQGDTNRKLKEIREREKEDAHKNQILIEEFNGTETVEEKDQIFEKAHDWRDSRYAGVSLYLPVLFRHWHWMKFVQGFFGRHFKIFFVFLLMAARNIRSMEQLKNIRSGEAAAVLGLERFPHPKLAREWFYGAAIMKRSSLLLRRFFQFQIRQGLVNLRAMFTDGHLLPYTGKDKVHYGYNTQRQRPMPGRTNQVSCDIDGRVVDFNIEEGKGNLKQRIVDLSRKWKEEISVDTVHVFDREGSGREYFSNLIGEGITFVTWEKHVDKRELDGIDDDRFSEEFSKNGKKYRVFEESKTYDFKPEGKEFSCVFNLRRIHLWNLASNRRTCGLSWSSPETLGTKECAEAILSRWGASENTFKHLKDRHPYHYHPGFKKEESDKQDIANPEIKAKGKQLARLTKKIDKAGIALGRTKDVANKNGTRRKNSKHSRLKKEIDELQSAREQLKSELKELPERVDVSTLTNYKSFKRIDNEGKNLFDFVTSSVWNARKWMVNQLLPYFEDRDEVVDLFYAITECHGWIKVTNECIYFRLEPLAQPKRRAAQEVFCRSITNLGAFAPNGKRMTIEVGERPQ
ncbi:MAG: hypothetical protein GY866_35290 [Proteobacteria bacterium]|nr:hypothetical protein [Pseudomonadota bacterium]